MYFSGEGGQCHGPNAGDKSLTHHRSNASISSTSSDLRTLNPDDKFLKPRPAPTVPFPSSTIAATSTGSAKPLSRLLTPQPYQISSSQHGHKRSISGPSSPSWDSGSDTTENFVSRPNTSSTNNLGKEYYARSRSQPSSATKRAFLVPRRRSPETKGLSSRLPLPSPSSQVGSGFRAVLTQFANSLIGEEPQTAIPAIKLSEEKASTNTSVNKIPRKPVPGRSGGRSGSRSRSHSRSSSCEEQDTRLLSAKMAPLAISTSAASSRRGSVEKDGEVIVANPFDFVHTEVGPRDTSPIRKPLSSENLAKHNWPGLPQNPKSNKLANLKDLPPRTISPPVERDSIDPDIIAATLAQLESDGTSTPRSKIEKRLPTLPNSPSSVIGQDAFLVQTPTTDMDSEQLRSHFSMSTVASPMDSPEDFADYPYKSHFSAWSTDTTSTYYRLSKSSVYQSGAPQSRFSDWTVADPRFSQPASPETPVPPVPRAYLNSLQQNDSNNAQSDASSPTLTSSPSLTSDGTELSSASSQLGSPFQEPYSPGLGSTKGRNSDVEVRLHDFALPLPLGVLSSGILDDFENLGLDAGKDRERALPTPTRNDPAVDIAPSSPTSVSSSMLSLADLKLALPSNIMSANDLTPTRMSVIANDDDADNDERVLDKVAYRDAKEEERRRKQAAEAHAKAQVDTIAQLMDELAYLSQTIRAE